MEVWYGTTITSNCCNAAHTHLLVFSKSVRSRSRSMRIVYISAECPINYNIMDRNEHYNIIWTQIFSDTSLKSRHLKFTRRHLRGREGCLPVLKNALTHMHEYLLCSIKSGTCKIAMNCFREKYLLEYFWIFNNCILYK